jgi:chromosome segregation ATPase
MLEDENDAQAQADAAWEEESAQCEASIAGLQDDIAAAQEKILENNVNMDILNSAIAGSQASLDEANDKLVTSTNALQNIIDQREAEHSTFLQDIADLSATITALQQGKDLINKLVAQEEEAAEEAAEEEAEAAATQESTEESGFFQKKGNKSVFSQFTSHITNANLKKTTKFHGFITALLTMLDGPHIFADQALVDQILRLIDHLVEMLSAEITTKSAAEADAQLSFDERSTSLSSDITNLNSKIADLQSEITDKSAKVADLVAENSNLDVNIANKSQQLADTQTTCNDDQNAYESTSEQRAGEIDIINQVINIFQTRFDNVAAYLSESAF